MSSHSTPLRSLPSSTDYRQHPDSVAERLHIEIRDRIQAKLRALSGRPPADDALNWLDLTPDSTPEEADEAFRNTFERQERRSVRTFMLPERQLISVCPLDVSWRRWDMLGPRRFDQRSAAEWKTCADARHTVPLRHLGLVQLAWEAVSDDARYAPMTLQGSGDAPSHFHAEVIIEGVRVHVDRVAATKDGPGRSFLEFRLFGNGELVGRGGRSAYSLGGGGSDLPAVARIGPNMAITVDDVSEGGRPTGELWDVSSRYFARTL